MHFKIIGVVRWIALQRPRGPSTQAQDDAMLLLKCAGREFPFSMLQHLDAENFGSPVVFTCTMQHSLRWAELMQGRPELLYREHQRVAQCDTLHCLAERRATKTRRHRDEAKRYRRYGGFYKTNLEYRAV